MRMALTAFLILAASIGSIVASDSDLKSEPVYSAWLQMYDLKFEDAHRALQQWQQTHGDFAQSVSMNKHGKSGTASPHHQAGGRYLLCFFRLQQEMRRGGLDYFL